MTSDQFCRWLVDMRLAGVAISNAECAELLGVSLKAISVMRTNGTDQRTALACRAVLQRLRPYGS